MSPQNQDIEIPNLDGKDWYWYQLKEISCERENLTCYLPCLAELGLAHNSMKSKFVINV